MSTMINIGGATIYMHRRTLQTFTLMNHQWWWVLFCNNNIIYYIICYAYIGPYQSSFLFPWSTECLFLIIHCSFIGGNFSIDSVKGRQGRHQICIDVLNSLKENGNALSTPNACGANAILLPIPPKFVNQVSWDPRARGGEGMAKGNCPSTGVELLQGDVQGFLAGKRLCRKRLVDFHL